MTDGPSVRGRAIRLLGGSRVFNFGDSSWRVCRNERRVRRPAFTARVKKAAARRAADDGRTLSDVIRRALVRDLVESGYLPPARRELPGRQPEAS
jgi:hypothetical protein